MRRNYRAGPIRGPTRGHGRGGRGRGEPNVRSHGPNDWQHWTELTVKLTGVPAQAGTLDVYQLLSAHGYILQISLEETRTGSRSGEAYVTFCPPPHEPFWVDWAPPEAKWRGVALEPQHQKRSFRHRSPVDSAKTYPEHQIILSDSIDFGFWSAPKQMMVMRSIDDAVLLLNLLKRELIIHFSTTVKTTRESYKIQIPLLQLRQILEVPSSADQLAIVLPLDQPSLFFRKLHNTEVTHDSGRRWSERKTWYRQTDIVEDPRPLRDLPLELRKRNPIIDIGRWTTLRFNLNLEQQRPAYNTIKEALCDYNVIFSQPDSFELQSRRESLFWDHIGADVENDGKNHTKSQTSLSWAIRYQLDVCISQSVLLEENITADFISALQKMPEREAILRLEYAAGKKDRLFDPSSLLALYVPLRTSVKIPQHCILSRSATVTPSTIYLSSPSVEMSNRILRQYKDHADRFLRVRFTDEKAEGRINSLDDESHNSVFTRIYHCLTNGITVGGRHYELLAMGNSQFREHGAYFFASAPGIMTAAEIRSKMGEFGHIKVVAKWASRLGQCFSTTRAIRGTKVKIVEIRDIERNGYTFTDGVGKISPQTAAIIASEVGIKSKSGEPPSVFQIRLGGIKGVLAVAPEAKNNEVHIRPSQYKFPALYEGLEVIRYSSYTSVVLNRQLITVLTAMGVRGRVFEDKMTQELRELEMAMTDSKVALEKLQHRIDFNQMTLTLANAVIDGFLDINEPFILSCMRLWRVWYHKSLKEKAGLTITEGAFVLGCVDETGSLQGHEEQRIDELRSRAEKIAALPQIFIQIDPLGTGVSQVITGVCLVARNPSLHPGDIRVVQAVDVPVLHHLRDVVVFSQQGIRDIPSMCSGGDLDGDDFVVIWDEKLIPPENSWDIPAMDFKGPEPIQVNRDVAIRDVIPFFVTYMKTDKLRSIATSHLANADWLQDGIRNPRCLELAELHSIAVDYPKSGVPATMRQDLRPYKYPHFMTSRWRAADRIYHSTTVLGKLYDKVTPLKFEPLIHLPFDSRILSAAKSAPEASLEAARTLKAEYDSALRRIMAQHDIATEFEVWTTFVLDHARITNEYSFHEELGRLASALRDRFQEAALEAVRQSLPEPAEMQRNGPEVRAFVAAMYRVTSEEVQAWTQKQQDHGNRGSEDPPLISFPWLFQRELGKLAGARVTDRGMDVMSTAADVVTPEVAKDAVRRAAAPTTASTLDDPMLIDFTSAPSAVAVATAENDGIETATGDVMHRGDLLELFQEMELDAPALAPSLTPSSVQSQDQEAWRNGDQNHADTSTPPVEKRKDSGAGTEAEAEAGVSAEERDDDGDMESGEEVIMGDDDDDGDQELTAFEKLQRMLE